jgi:hypothetical protein
MSRFLVLDKKLLDQIEILVSDLTPENSADTLALGISLLEGDPSHEAISEAASKFSPPKDEETVYLMAQALGALFWECAKGAPKDPNVINNVLAQTGLSGELVEALSKSFKRNQPKFATVKNALSVSKRRYVDMSWRLDMELARRTMTVMTDPKYLIRLDVNEPIAGSSAYELKSYHLQADYANMKRMQTELQRAVDDLNGTHSSRMMRYIS